MFRKALYWPRGIKTCYCAPTRETISVSCTQFLGTAVVCTRFQKVQSDSTDKLVKCVQTSEPLLLHREQRLQLRTNWREIARLIFEM